MSKRAEDAGLRAYPRAPFGPQNITDDDCNRQVYIRGYEQAEKDYIELTQLWVDSGDANVMSFKQFLKRKLEEE